MAVAASLSHIGADTPCRTFGSRGCLLSQEMWDCGTTTKERAPVLQSRSMAAPVIQFIQPKVEGHPNPKWFVRFASGHLAWMTPSEVALCNRNGVAAEPFTLSRENYANLCAQAHTNDDTPG